LAELRQEYAARRTGWRSPSSPEQAGLLRLAQDCSDAYGLVLHEIETLTPFAYAEREIIYFGTAVRA
jgi:hypothetical protein